MRSVSSAVERRRVKSNVSDVNVRQHFHATNGTLAGLRLTLWARQEWPEVITVTGHRVKKTQLLRVHCLSVMQFIAHLWLSPSAVRVSCDHRKSSTISTSTTTIIKAKIAPRKLTLQLGQWCSARGSSILSHTFPSRHRFMATQGPRGKLK